MERLQKAPYGDDGNFDAALFDVLLQEELGCWQDEEGQWHHAGEATPLGSDGAHSPALLNREEVYRRCRKYVDQMPASISGQNGHSCCWNAAQAIFRGFDLTPSEGWPILLEFNARCQPPWSEEELRHKVESVEQKSKLARGYIISRSTISTKPWQQPHVQRIDVSLIDDDDPIYGMVDAGKAVDDFPVECLPDSLAEFADEIHRAIGCPVDFPGVAMLMVAAAAMGATRAIQLKKKWIECARFYMAQVADPGTGKSPAMDIITAPLADRQKAAKRVFEEKLEQYERDKETFEATKRQASRTPGSYLPPKPIPPKFPHYFVIDATTESLGPILEANPRGTILIRDELTGWVTGMDQYKNGKGSDRQFWLSCWAGAMAKIDRKGQQDRGSILVPHPFICVVGCIPPDMLSSFCDEKFREDGFLHRILFSYPYAKAGRRWSEAEPTEHKSQFWDDCVARLLALEMVPTQDGGSRPFVATMSPKAKEFWVAWNNGHSAEMEDEDFPGNLLGPWSKMVPHAARLALTVHYMRWACLEPVGDVIDHLSMACGLKLAQYFKSHLRRVFARLTTTPEDRLIERVIARAKRDNGKITAKQMQMSKFVNDAPEARKLLIKMANRNLGKIVYKEIRGQGRLPDAIILHSNKDIVTAWTGAQLHPENGEAGKP